MESLTGHCHSWLQLKFDFVPCSCDCKQQTIKKHTCFLSLAQGYKMLQETSTNLTVFPMRLRRFRFSMSGIPVPYAPCITKSQFHVGNGSWQILCTWSQCWGKNHVPDWVHNQDRIVLGWFSLPSFMDHDRCWQIATTQIASLAVHPQK